MTQLNHISVWSSRFAPNFRRLAQLQVSTLCLLYALQAFTCSNLFAANTDSTQVPVFSFDFCQPKGDHALCMYVSHEATYRDQTGYGFLHQVHDQETSEIFSSISDRRIRRIVASDSALEFRVNIPNGRYFVELVMDGGRLSTWRGRIVLNGALVDTVMNSIAGSEEGENPPPSWHRSFISNVTERTLVIGIQAIGQPSTIASLRILPVAQTGFIFSQGTVSVQRDDRTPNGAHIINLINAGAVREAFRGIDALPNSSAFEQAQLLFAVASRIECENPRQAIEQAVALLKSEYVRSGDSRLPFHIRLGELAIEADRHKRAAGWDWARQYYGTGIFGNSEINGMALQSILTAKDHPLVGYATLELAKTWYWMWVEQHAPRQLSEADSLFAELNAWFPNSPIIKAYMGDRNSSTLFRSLELPDEQGVPHWAALQHRAIQELTSIIHYWVLNRQNGAGEFGGKYDDDVEMLRWWTFSRLATNDSIALSGIRKLVDGIWGSDWIYNGYSRKVRDVEHSSEPVADTQPMMIGFDYGNPVYVERCMESVRLMKELWTSKNSHGHRHFKSAWFSSTQVDTTSPKDVDVPMNTRAVKAVRWLAWYNQNPDAMTLLREWADAWLEDCKRTDAGKPKWIVPAAVRFSDDQLGGASGNWHHPKLFWNYYDYSGGSYVLLEFISSYLLLGDRKYLEPIEESIKLVRRHDQHVCDERIEGSECWAVGVMKRSAGFRDVVELWRLLTGDRTYDAFLRKNGSPYVQYRLSGEQEAMNATITTLLQDIAYQYPLLTTEAYFTDRVEARNLRKTGEHATTVLESMMFGMPTVSLFHPFSAVSWSNLDTMFSALVTMSTETTLSIRTFNHDLTDGQGNLVLYQLLPGRYELTQRNAAHGSAKRNMPSRKEIVEIANRPFTIPLTLKSRTEELIELKAVSVSRTPSKLRCDIAAVSSDVVMEDHDGTIVLKTVIHNIGSLDATDVRISIIDRLTKSVLATTEIKKVDAPANCRNSVVPVELRMNAGSGKYSFIVAMPRPQDEITLVNNRFDFEATR